MFFLRNNIRIAVFCYYISIFVSIFCFFSFGSGNFSNDLDSNQTEYLKNSVWRISDSSYSGTGFFTAPNYFVTNFHIVFAMLQNTDVKDIVLSQEGSSLTLKVNRVLALSAVHDLALIETENFPDHLAIESNQPAKAEDLFILGYPERIFTNIQKIADIFSPGNDIYSFAVNSSSLHGISGSPVFNKLGHVVGVASQGADNILLAVNPDHLKKFVTGDLNCIDFANSKSCVKEEMKKLKRLAEAGVVLAQFHLANILSEGEGIEMNSEQAFGWMFQAADQGFVFAQSRLAAMYYEGEGVARNLTEAVKWWTRAADQGYAVAQSRLAAIYFEGEEEIERDAKKAFVLWTLAAMQGHFVAQSKLGDMLYEGKEVKRNLKEAYKWWTKASKVSILKGWNPKN